MKKLLFGLVAIFALVFSFKGEAQNLKGKFSIQRQTGKQIDLFRTEGKYKYHL